MKKIIFAALAAAICWEVKAADAQWLTDLPKAEAQAKTENKIVVMDFTGSDWCPACIALRKKVLDSKKFQTYAAANAVLVEVDFPDKKAQSGDLKKANEALKDKYKIDGFPTLVVLDQSGKEIGRQEGYDGSSPQEIITALEKFRSGK